MLLARQLSQSAQSSHQVAQQTGSALQEEVGAGEIAERLKVLSATHAVCSCSMNCRTELRNTVGRADTRREAGFHTT
jgi:hypothetical protein